MPNRQNLVESHRSSSSRLSLLLLVLFLGVSACQKDIPPPDNAIEEPEKLRQAIETRAEQYQTGRFKEVVLDYFGKNERVKVRQLILVEKPDMLRVQTRLPGSNEIMNLLVTNGDEFAMHNRDNNEYITGKPTPRNINRLLPVDLSARDVVRVMFGGAPWDRFAREVGEPNLEWDRETGRYRYWVATADGGSLSMQVRPTDYGVISVTERDAGGELTYQYTTDDWERFGPVALPTWRRFVWPSRDLDFSLDVNQTELDVELPDSLFNLSPPPGSEIIEVEG